MTTKTLNGTAGSLLGFLHEAPMSGWELAQKVEATIGNFWNVTRSQIYRELRALDEAGFVEAGDRGARDRVRYRVTAAGKGAFAEWIAQRPGPELIRMPILLAVYFGRHLEPDVLQRFLLGRRLEDMEKLETYRRLLPLVEGDPYLTAAVRFGIAYRETVLRWLDELPWDSEPASPPQSTRPRKRR